MQSTLSPNHNDSPTLQSSSKMNKLAPHHDRTFCALKAKHFLRFASSLFLPLMLGIFTVIITFRQQTEADRQRLEDRQLSREQREQDLNLSRDQREQDQEQARLLREQDLNISRLQRELDKQIAEERRQFDLKLSQQKETRELFIAEKQRNMSEQHRSNELDIEITRRREELFTSYVKEFSMFLTKFNGTPTAHPVTAALIRVKTLTAVRQLDPVRNSYLIHFLYIAGQLTNGEHPPPIDLSDALLNNIDLSRGAHDKPMHGLSLAGAYLRNASFAKRDLSGANFQAAILSGSQFSPDVILSGANFAGANLIKAKFYSEKVESLPGETVSIIDTVNYSFTPSIGCYCMNVNFDNTILTSSDLSFADLRGATFRGATLDRARLLGANAENVDFTRATMYGTNCTKMKSGDASFYRVKGPAADFRKANLTGANFNYAIADLCDFSEADLSFTVLYRTRLYRTKWSESNLFAANFSYAALTEAYNLTDEQLLSTISIRNTIFPNGTFGRDKTSLIENGLAVCNTDMIKINNSWSWESDEVVVTRPLNNSSKHCVFAPALNATRSISMFQKVDLRKYRPQIVKNNVALSLSAVFGKSTVVALEWPQWNTTHSHQHILSENIL